MPWGSGKVNGSGNATVTDIGDEESNADGEEHKEESTKSESDSQSPTTVTSSGMRKVRTSSVSQPTLALPGEPTAQSDQPQTTPPVASAAPAQGMVDGSISFCVSWHLVALSLVTLWMSLL